ncbi:hypothetical protein [Roseisolibacter agri]|nr:hypothetical protein [Roseisolibacter agri]
MSDQHASRASLAVRGGALALLWLAGSVALSFPASLLATEAATRVGLGVSPTIFRVVTLMCAAAGGALWGRMVARVTGARATRVAAHAGLGFGLSTVTAVMALTGIETALLAHAQAGGAVPMHLAFAALFPAATGLVVLATVLAAGLGARVARGRALRVAGRCALAATAVFLTLVVAMDAAGWRVGAPDAEARFTMVVVTIAGLLLATAVAGALALPLLRRAGPERQLQQG